MGKIQNTDGLCTNCNERTGEIRQLTLTRRDGTPSHHELTCCPECAEAFAARPFIEVGSSSMR
jgi:hypothetical protein